MVQADDGVGGHRRGAQKGGPQGGGQLAGALEVEAGEGVLEFRELEHLQHHVGAHQQGVHLIGIEFAPEGHQIVIGEGGGGGRLVRFRLIVVAVPVHQHIHTVGEQHPGDVCADLPQSDGKQVQLLVPHRLIGGHQHAPPLVELHQVGLDLDGGGGDGRPLVHRLQLLLVAPGLGGDGAVVHPFKAGGGGGDGGEQVGLLHALAHRAGDVLGEQHRRVGGAEELLHRVGARPLHLDVKALELPLEGVQPLQTGALVLLRGVQPLQHLGKGAARLLVHPLLQADGVKLIRHSKNLLFLTDRPRRSWPQRPH